MHFRFLILLRLHRILFDPSNELFHLFRGFLLLGLGNLHEHYRIWIVICIISLGCRICCCRRRKGFLRSCWWKIVAFTSIGLWASVTSGRWRSLFSSYSCYPPYLPCPCPLGWFFPSPSPFCPPSPSSLSSPWSPLNL